jgi:hypothetical protein
MARFRDSEVLVHKTLRLLGFTATFGTAVIVGCSSNSSTDGGGANLPPRDSGTDGGQTNTSSSSGSTTDADTGYDCSKHAPVDNSQACDQCTRSKCCEWITKCDGSPSCKAAQDCLAACDPNDFPCILTCATTAGTGGDYLQELGACVANGCKSECPQPTVDAGFDGF